MGEHNVPYNIATPLPDKATNLEVIEVFSDAPSPSPAGIKKEADEDEEEDEDEDELTPAVSAMDADGPEGGAEGSRRKLRQRGEVNYHVKTVRVKRQPDTLTKKGRKALFGEVEVVIPVWRPIKTQRSVP